MNIIRITKKLLREKAKNNFGELSEKQKKYKERIWKKQIS